MPPGKTTRSFYSLSTCPFCKRMKGFLDENGISYDLIEVDTLGDGEQWAAMKELKKYNPDATFPTVVVAEVYNDIDSLRETLKKNDR